jgi:hypothetical protein
VEVEAEVSIDPAEATVSAGENVLFTVEVKGAEDPTVTWSVPGGDSAGSITADGLYTAPALASGVERSGGEGRVGRGMPSSRQATRTK